MIPRASCVVPPAALAVFGSAIVFLAGCATVPVSHKVRPDAIARMSTKQSVRAAPLDVHVAEISAGGLTEKHDELTSLVGKNFIDAISAEGVPLAAPSADFDTGPVWVELAEVQALLRAITVNDAMPIGAADAPGGGPRPLTYHVGRIDRLADALGGDAVLFVFVRDQYSTGGRKAVMALAMIAGAAAGVAVSPSMGVTATSAALVDRDGTVLWFNSLGAAGQDLRTPAAATAWVKKLLAGLPPLPTGSRANPPTAETPRTDT